MRVISTLKTVWTCGLVRLDSTMRLRDDGAHLRHGDELAGQRLRRGRFGGEQGPQLRERQEPRYRVRSRGFRATFEVARAMSSLVMRPEAPVPATCDEVHVVLLRDLANERRGARTLALDCGGRRGAAGSGGSGAGAAGAGAAAAAAGAAAFPAAPPMTATTVLIVTVEPSGTLISERTPATGDGISASTLSVEISKIGSSR